MEGRFDEVICRFVMTDNFRLHQMPKEIASDLVKLSLFDTILYIDDSGSMAFEQGELLVFRCRTMAGVLRYFCPLQAESESMT